MCIYNKLEMNSVAGGFTSNEAQLTIYRHSQQLCVLLQSLEWLVAVVKLWEMFPALKTLQANRALNLEYCMKCHHYLEMRNLARGRRSDVTRSTPEVSGRLVTLAQRQTPTCHNHGLGVIRTHDVAGQIQLSETAPWVFNNVGKLSKVQQSLWTI